MIKPLQGTAKVGFSKNRSLSEIAAGMADCVAQGFALADEEWQASFACLYALWGDNVNSTNRGRLTNEAWLTCANRDFFMNSPW